MQLHSLIFAVLLRYSSAFGTYPSTPAYTDKQLQWTIFPVCSALPDTAQIDACVGCYWRLITHIEDPNYTGPYTDCSSLYLKSTMYSRCADNLQENAANQNGSAFCDFDECVHDLRSQQAILECASEPQGEKESPVDHFTKTVKCVICRSHCWEQKFNVQASFGQYLPALTVEHNMLKTISSSSYNGDSGRSCSRGIAAYGGFAGNIDLDCDCSA